MGREKSAARKQGLWETSEQEDTVQWETFEGENFHEFQGFMAIYKSFIRKIWGCGIVLADQVSNPSH